jgi:hypothetical protein
MTTGPLAKQGLVIALVMGLMVAGTAGIAPAAEPEAIFFNAKIATLNAAGSTAGAVAVQDGKILKLGSADEIKGHYPQFKPGLISFLLKSLYCAL